MPDHKNKKITATKKTVKKIDPNVSTRTYNAATGITHELIQDDAGNNVTPGYDPKKAPQYEANAIKKYGSLEASRKAYANLPPRAGGPSRGMPMKEGSPLYGKISSACKAAAKKKFKVWPSAYASGWGVRCTKAGGPSKFGGGKKKK